MAVRGHLAINRHNQSPMFNLLQLFLKLSGFFLFVVLEILCFSLIVKYNQRQSEIYVNTVNNFTGYLQAKAASTLQYFKLYDENKRLERENALLYDRLANVGINLPKPLDTVWADSLKSKYAFTGARIIRNSVNQHHNYITLDKGSKDGVVPHSGVVTENGVVGIVRKVSEHYSVAMSILHRQTRISARLKHKGYFGPLVWEGDDIHTFKLTDISKDKSVAKGDTVETSGYSAIFPEGIMLGVVEKFWLEPGSNYFSIQVKSSLDLSNLQHVYIVRNLRKNEQYQLEQAVREEDE